MTKLLRERDLGVFVEPARMRLDEFLNKRLETTARPRVRPRTFESYAGLVRLHVGPELGTRPLAAITPLEVQALCAKMGEQGPAPRTVRYVYSVLRSALEQAVRWRMLLQNPARHVDLPRQQRREMRALSADEALRFLEAAEGTRYGVLFELLLATGLRPGEALALRWTDIDLEAGRLHVRRSLTRTEEFEEPKTANARRSLPLPASTVQALRRHQRQQAEERLAAGGAWQDLGLVFPTETGGPVTAYRSLVRHYFQPLLKKAGLPRTVRLHDPSSWRRARTRRLCRSGWALPA
ncbi:MAG: tyrosine-type recombinase/integrase [Bacillota bacterium]